MNTDQPTNELFKALLDSADAPVAVLGMDGRFLYANEPLAKLLGTDPAQLVGELDPRVPQHLLGWAARSAPEPSAPRSADDRTVTLVESLAGEPALTFELRYFPIRDTDGTQTGIGMVADDVTEERRQRELLTVVGERFRHAFEDSNVAMAMTTLDGRVIDANAAMTTLLGYTREDVARMSINDVLLSDERRQRKQMVAAAISGEQDAFVVESHVRRSDGVLMWAVRHITVLRNADGSAREMLTQLIDATEHHRIEQHLRHLADHDPLTDVLNRRGFNEILSRHISHERRACLDSCLMLLDLNDFKIVNDLCGHAAGDQILIGLTDVLRERLRASDAIGRLGGDEFAVLLPETELAGAISVAEQIAAEVPRRLVLDFPGAPSPVSVSIGVASLAGAEYAGVPLVDAADRAMYQAKSHHLRRIAVFQPVAAADVERA